MLTAEAAESGPNARVYLCGRVMLECGDVVLRDGALGGAQGRLLLAFLGTRRTRLVSRLETVEAVWGAEPPPSVDISLNAIVSKLRGRDILELVPNPLLSQNEIAAARSVRFDHFNPQGQQRFVWPASFALARAYLDQLERS